jgi:CHAT domain-containing protein
VDSLAAKRRELVDALQSSASDRTTLDLKVFRRAMVQSALKPWPKRDGEDPSFDADQYASGYSRCGHPVANCLPGYPLVQVATTVKGTVAVLSRVTEKSEVQTETLEIGFTSGDLDMLMYGSGEDQGWLDGLSRQSQDSVAWLNWQALVERVSMRLGTSLMRPLVEWIAASHDRCTLITHGRLSLLPLHVAAWPTSSGTACVLDILDVAFAPSVRLLAQARENFARTRVLDLVAVVDPRPTTKAPIPCAKLEVDVVAPRFTRKWGPAYMGARVCDGDSATRYFVQSCLNGEYAKVVHVACHAITDIAMPKRSGIVLSEDERLTASDLLRVRRSTGRLAVLSCCETALTDQSQPEEALSFPATFLGCGFAGVIGSLWEVEDASTALLMIRFYEEWFDNGMHPSAALRSAQRWLSNASRREIGEYLSDERLPWYHGRISSGEQTALRDAWAGLRNMLPDTPASERPFSSLVYWGAFLAFGV